jgi:hypothetical protein
MQPTNQQILDKLDEIEDTLRGHVSDSMVWRSRVEVELTENTRVTSEVKELQTTGKVLRNILIWVGGAAAALVGIVQLWQAMSTIVPTP